jgi:AraC-like DNA-binding protein
MKTEFYEKNYDGDVSLDLQKEDCIIRQIQNRDGGLIVTEYNVFPGVWLLYRDIHMSSRKNPDGYPSGLLEITYCHKGRIEYDMGDRVFYLSEGDMVVNRSVEDAMLYFPTKYHVGISVIIDPNIAPTCFSTVLDNVKVGADEILDKFCRDNAHFIMRSTQRVSHIFSELYSISDATRSGYVRIKILELLLFLKDLDVEFSETDKHMYTKGQMDLAQKVCDYISKNMDTRPTIEELASMFYVSPTQLKKSFQNVYGQSIYSFIRTYKMKYAAHLLETTEQTISEVADTMGYDNCSKFSKAFRDIMGASPTEYRKTFLEQ